MYKICKKCNKNLSTDFFHKKSSSKDGLDSRCKNCKKEISKNYYKKNKNRILEKNKEWANENSSYFNEYNHSHAGVKRRKRYEKTVKYRNTKLKYTHSQKGIKTQKNKNTSERSKRARKRRAKVRLVGIIKTESGCIDCGFNLHPRALEFDHISDNKRANVSNLIRSDYSWKTILEEIAKCEVVCANCHAIRTANRSVGLN